VNQKRDKQAPSEPRDNTREAIDLIVTVVVLVLLIKSILIEVFVIPTGSMATTLLGYNKMIPCPQCGHEFEVNFSKQANPEEENPESITGCQCPNCRLFIELLPQDSPVPLGQGQEQ